MNEIPTKMQESVLSSSEKLISASSYDVVPSIDDSRVTDLINNNDKMQHRKDCIRFNWLSSLKYFIHIMFVFLPKTIWNGLRLLLFVLILLVPGFLRIAWYYWISSSRISRPYQTKSCRQTIDIYGAVPPTSSSIRCRINSSNSDVAEDNSESNGTIRSHANNRDHETSASTCQSNTKKPVLIFAPGGAWLIGYKMWGVFTARAIEPFGILIIVCDYRNYPWGTVPDMVDDITDAITWSINNCESFGGDPDRVILLGQSAGGHLMSSALLRQAFQKVSCTFIKPKLLPTDQICDNEYHQDLLSPIRTEEEILLSSIPKHTICGLISLSSPYDVNMMSKSFKRYGLSHDLVYRIFGGKINDYDPQALIQNYRSTIPDNNENNSVQRLSLPPIAIFHGTCDKAVPYQGSEDFAHSLQSKLGISNVTLKFYEGWSHTDAILEGIFISDHRFHINLCNLCFEWTGYNPRFDANHPSCRRLTSDMIVQIARWLNPF